MGEREMAAALEQHAGVNLTAAWAGSPDPTNYRNIRRVCKCGAVIGRSPWPKKATHYPLAGHAFDAPHREHIARVLTTPAPRLGGEREGESS